MYIYILYTPVRNSVLVQPRVRKGPDAGGGHADADALQNVTDDMHHRGANRQGAALGVTLCEHEAGGYVYYTYTCVRIKRYIYKQTPMLCRMSPMTCTIAARTARELLLASPCVNMREEGMYTTHIRVYIY